jgi:hypothetical protein
MIFWFKKTLIKTFGFETVLTDQYIIILKDRLYIYDVKTNSLNSKDLLKEFTINIVKKV